MYCNNFLPVPKTFLSSYISTFWSLPVRVGGTELDLEYWSAHCNRSRDEDSQQYSRPSSPAHSSCMHVQSAPAGLIGIPKKHVYLMCLFETLRFWADCPHVFYWYLIRMERIRSTHIDWDLSSAEWIHVDLHMYQYGMRIYKKRRADVQVHS